VDSNHISVRKLERTLDQMPLSAASSGRPEAQDACMSPPQKDKAKVSRHSSRDGGRVGAAPASPATSYVHVERHVTSSMPIKHRTLEAFDRKERVKDEMFRQRREEDDDSSSALPGSVPGDDCETTPLRTTDANTIDSDFKIFPRRKGGQSKKGAESAPVIITAELLQACYDMPLVHAAKKLGICATALKKVCRKLGIHKWPYKEMKPSLSLGRHGDGDGGSSSLPASPRRREHSVRKPTANRKDDSELTRLTSTQPSRHHHTSSRTSNAWACPARGAAAAAGGGAGGGCSAGAGGGGGGSAAISSHSSAFSSPGLSFTQAAGGWPGSLAGGGCHGNSGAGGVLSRARLAEERGGQAAPHEMHPLGRGQSLADLVQQLTAVQPLAQRPQGGQAWARARNGGGGGGGQRDSRDAVGSAGGGEIKSLVDMQSHFKGTRRPREVALIYIYICNTPTHTHKYTQCI
jgi:hypothetical protein